LALYARNLTSPERELSLNAIGERQIGTITRVLVAAAVLAKARDNELSLATTVPYPKDAYRGNRGTLKARHTTRFSLDELLRASIRSDDPAATDLLIGWLGGQLPAWVDRLGVPGMRPVSSHGQRDRFVLRTIDPRFENVSMHAAQRWLRDGDAAGITPTPFPEDPRRLDDHVLAIGSAWGAWYRQRHDTVPLRGLADAFTGVLQGTGVQRDSVATADHKPLKSLLRGIPTVACARDLGLHLAVTGCDSASWRMRTSVALVETTKGTIIIAAHAQGFASSEEAGHLIARLGESAVRRLAPGAWRPNDDPLPRDLPRALRSITLKDAEGGQRTDFDVGDVAHLVVETAAVSESILTVRWLKADGTCAREARPLKPGGFATETFEVRLAHPGHHRLELALGNRPVYALTFQVRASR